MTMERKKPTMDLMHPITRRQSLKRIAWVSASLAMSALGVCPFLSRRSTEASTADKGFVIEGLGSKGGYKIKDLTRKSF